ncbi:DNA polymerase III subunit alpha [Alkalitalea saponilacus]|uniref:DNA polymerase III subunit alpha n=1 Tax=Alkalitalea saponilacus TaxID=889453 RepID=A0A1T5HT99_9BACT|nr:DNA polymerase III subunit alpha [Alkalitalea saponilacus]ASB48951.1 DNA polymerase III subunit alpha [Alkalitalea saponilacus]SKC23904.1 DNA polymerase-3 subunit alpha [Alkalitalea saponilacus]
MANIPFTHLHVHSQYSILDGQASVQALVNKAVEDGMSAIALTDHGTMLGIKEFYDLCKKKKIKPIIGVEAYVAERTIADRSDKNLDRSGRHLVILAKNLKGYKNLLKLTSIAYVEGFFYRPRIDKQLLEKHHEGLIITSACLGGEIPRKIINNDFDGAKEAILWYKNLFGEDFYLELQRHPSEDPRMRKLVYDEQKIVNEKLVEFSKELGVKVIAANDVHFADAAKAEAHDVMICLNTGKDQDDESRMRYTRQEWFKTTAEMNQLFADIPEALQNTMEIADKVEIYELDSPPIMPLFPIPEDFGSWEGYREKISEDDLKEEFGAERYASLGGDYDHLLRVKLEADYLEHLAYVGAKKFYGDPVPDNVKERIDFELNTVKTMGFPGYFLIVQDFINAARDMGVLVGPGRGSAAGSAVAYCVGITSVDPIKFDLLFERFLNPDRISMPDVDIDFDDDGRQLVLNWVADKYGKDKVAHICTLGTMAAKSAIKDVGRVLKLPLSETDRISKLIPEKPGTKLANAYKEVLNLEVENGTLENVLPALERKLSAARSANKDKEVARLEMLRIFATEMLNGRNSGNETLLKTLELACDLEGSIRQTGVHACGVLIGRDPLDEHIPLMPAKEGVNLLVTQYEGNLVESIGLLKMDFLGLKTLSIIKETLEAIKLSKGFDLDMDDTNFTYDDEKTFELFSRGETTAIFQFESAGMKKYLRELQPNRFEDLVAMNALYRPGPMEYIPNYVARKHGREDINYDHPLMESYLEETYGITVFQEQVMLLSRKLAGFTRGESDSLRKAMGKKLMEVMAKLKAKFSDGCKNNPKFIEGCEKVAKKPDVLIEKIWKDWEAFASYAFNKSHSVCYANLAYKTGYLKAHYPAEFMAGVLSRNLNDISKITTFMEECRRMGLEVLGPDVNESHLKFTVNKKGALRFGMAAIKGVGEGVVQEIIKEREKNGPYKDVFDFIERISLQTVNKKAIEALAGAGGFDSLGNIHRAQFFAVAAGDDGSFIEKLIRYGNRYQSDKATNQNSLFGTAELAVEIKKPDIPQCLEFSTLEKLEKEKDLIGMYLSAHPLDDYRLEIQNYCNLEVSKLNDIETLKGREFTVGGMVTNVRQGFTKKGNKFSILTLEDYSGSFDFAFFGEDYIKFNNYFESNLFIMVKGKVQPKKFRPEEFEAKVHSISLLADILDNQVKCLTLRIPLSGLTNEVVTELAHITMENKGKVSLRFQVYDEENERQNIKLLSRNVMVNLTGDLVRFFEERPEISMILS